MLHAGNDWLDRRGMRYGWLSQCMKSFSSSNCLKYLARECVPDLNGAYTCHCNKWMVGCQTVFFHCAHSHLHCQIASGHGVNMPWRSPVSDVALWQSLSVNLYRSHFHLRIGHGVTSSSNLSGPLPAIPYLVDKRWPRCYSILLCTWHSICQICPVQPPNHKVI